MSNPTFEYTTIDKIVARCKIRLKLEHTNTEDLFLKDCVIEAAKEMSTKQDFLEYTAILTIANFEAELPCNFVMFDRGNWFNPPLVFSVDGRVINDAPIVNGTVSAIVTNAPFLTNIPYGEIGNGWYYNATFNIQNGKIHFSSNVDATECTISYLGVNLDDAGQMQIPANNERPIMNYAMSEYALANGYPNNVVQEYRRIWTQGKLDRRGRSQVLDVYQRAILSRIMNT